MKSSVRNALLILALGTVIIMCVGIFLYDYIPSGLTVSKANQYETTAATTAILSDAQEAQALLTAQTQSTSSTTISTPTVKTNIVLTEYDVSRSDLAMYNRSGSYEPGRPDPFAEVTATPTSTSTSNASNSTVVNTTTNTTPSDGTYYNTARTK